MDTVKPATPAYTFPSTDDCDGRLYRQDASKIGFAVGGTLSLALSDVTNGYPNPMAGQHRKLADALKALGNRDRDRATAAFSALIQDIDRYGIDGRLTAEDIVNMSHSFRSH